MGSPPVPGRIVWAVGPDPRGGNPKARPWVVASGVDAAGMVLLAAVTTQIGQAPFAETVPLPFDPAGHPETRLKRPSEVVCSWSVYLPPADLTDSGGSVPADLLNEVLAKIRVNG